MARWGATFWEELCGLYQLARREKLTLLIGWLFSLMVVASLVFFLSESRVNPAVNTYSEALYWSVISITTVGYGDIVPVTTVGRICSVVILLSFMGLMPLLWATITSIYVSQKIKEESGLDKINFRNHVLICGWNNNGRNILAGLNELNQGVQVVLVGDLSQDLVNDQLDRFPDLDLHFVRGPYTGDATLARAGAKHARVAIVLVNYGLDSLTRSDEHAVLAVLTLKEIGPELRIVAECFSSSYRGHLRRAGADRVVVSGELDSYMLTAAALSPGLDSTVQDALTFGSGHDLWTQPVPREYIGKTFKDLARNWLDEKSWIVIGIIKADEQLGVSEVLGGDRSSIDEFIVRKFEEAGRGRGQHKGVHYLNPGEGYAIGNGDLAVVIYPAEERNA